MHDWRVTDQERCLKDATLGGPNIADRRELIQGFADHRTSVQEFVERVTRVGYSSAGDWQSCAPIVTMSVESSVSDDGASARRDGSALAERYGRSPPAMLEEGRDRMHRLTREIALVLALGSASCAAPRAAQDAKADILRTDAEWKKAVSEGRDIERIVSYWADDAIVMPPSNPPVVGKNAIREFVVESFHMPGFTITWETMDVVVAPGGDMAYATGTNHVAFDDEDGEKIELDGKTATVWRRQSDGAWKCVLDIWNESGSGDE
jgi:ketosteroid isomerase-like protein